MREVVNFLHQEYPKAPLFTVGTSIGANIVVGLVFLPISHPVKKLLQLLLNSLRLLLKFSYNIAHLGQVPWRRR